MRRALLLTGLAGVALVGGLSLLQTYTVRNDKHHAQLLWNDRDAYVFADTSRVGWRLSYRALLVSMARYAFGGATPPDDKRVAVTVLHVQPSKVERHVIERSHASDYGLWDGRIFSPGAGIWSGTSFEPLSAEEQIRARQANVRYNDFSNVDGWSGRCCIMHRQIGETVFPMALGGHRMALVVRKTRAARGHPSHSARTINPSARSGGWIRGPIECQRRNTHQFLVGDRTSLSSRPMPKSRNEGTTGTGHRTDPIVRWTCRNGGRRR